MSYQKKPKYPSIKTPGVYFDENSTEDNKKLGLDTDDLEKFSLGNWNSIIKENKIFPGSSTGTQGKPVLITFDRAMLNYGIGRVTYNLVNGVKTNIKYRGKVWPDGQSNGDPGDWRLYDMNDFPIISPSSDGTVTPEQQAFEYEKVARHIAVWSHFFTGRSGGPEYDIIIPQDNSDFPTEGSGIDGQANFWKMHVLDWSPVDGDDLTFNAGPMISNRNKTKIPGFIQPRNASNDSIQDGTYNQGSPIRISIDGADNLIHTREFHIDHQDYPREFTSNSYPTHEGGLMGHGGTDGWTHEVFFPLYFRLYNTVGPDEHRFFGKVISVPIPGISNYWEFSIGQMDMPHLTVSTTGLGNGWATMNNSPTDVYYWLAKLGMPTFNNNITLSDETLLDNLNVERELFIVDTKTDNDNEFLYHDQNEDAYDDTSYPVKVNLNIGLYNDFINDLNFQNQLLDPDPTNEAANLFYTDSSVPQQEVSLASYFELENTYFTYQVIQWGDEKTLLTNDAIESSYFLNLYNEEDEALVSTNWSYRKWIAAQKISTSIAVPMSHVYNTPGIKPIKIIIWRYDNAKQFLLQTYLVTKNIVINDGNLKAQDFSIFGGTDFTFLPITDNQVIIGGLDTYSEYNISAEKIAKDDDFTADDYLQRASSKDYIDKINNNFLGKRPGQLDIGQARVFKEPKDIYDFIGGDKLEIINNGLDSLPINSYATDIFINDDKCIVDLNPSNTDYSVIQNQKGLNEIGILIGDYILSQPKNSKVQKQGVMKTPLLDTNADEQAF